MISLIHFWFMLSISIIMSNTSFAQKSDFPLLQARTLAGENIEYPKALAGNKSLLVMVFEDIGRYQEAQSQANQWLAVCESRWQRLGILAHEIPMMGGVWKIARSYIDEGMRLGLPVEKHSSVSCFYGDKDKYRRLLAIEKFAEAQVFLLDENGSILLQTHGAPDENTINQIQEILAIN